MSHFASKKLNGVVHDLSHLNPFRLSVKWEEKVCRVYVVFGCHCFTEERLEWHSPDRTYTHMNETRSFCPIRYAASKKLPDLIRDLDERTVYYGKEYNYFVLRNHDLLGNAPPYAVFFDVVKAENKRLGDTIMRVQSAYQKPNMVETAAPITFNYLVSTIASGRRPTPGKPVTIKRK